MIPLGVKSILKAQEKVTAGTLLNTEDNPSNNFPTLNRMLSATPPTSNGCLTITKTNS